MCLVRCIPDGMSGILKIDNLFTQLLTLPYKHQTTRGNLEKPVSKPVSERQVPVAKAGMVQAYPADLLISGNTHVWEYLQAERPDGSTFHALQLDSYMRFDDFARSLCLPRATNGSSAVAIVNPKETGPGRITIFWNVSQAVEYLKYLRSR